MAILITSPLFCYDVVYMSTWLVLTPSAQVALIITLRTLSVSAQNTPSLHSSIGVPKNHKHTQVWQHWQMQTKASCCLSPIMNFHFCTPCTVCLRKCSLASRVPISLRNIFLGHLVHLTSFVISYLVYVTSGNLGKYDM